MRLCVQLSKIEHTNSYNTEEDDFGYRSLKDDGDDEVDEGTPAEHDYQCVKRSQIVWNCLLEKFMFEMSTVRVSVLVEDPRHGDDHQQHDHRKRADAQILVERFHHGRPPSQLNNYISCSTMREKILPAIFPSSPTLRKSPALDFLGQSSEYGMVETIRLYVLCHSMV